MVKKHVHKFINTKNETKSDQKGKNKRQRFEREKGKNNLIVRKNIQAKGEKAKGRPKKIKLKNKKQRKTKEIYKKKKYIY